MRTRLTLGLAALLGACNVINDLDDYEFVDTPPGSGGMGGSGGETGGEGGVGGIGGIGGGGGAGPTFTVTANVVRLSTAIELTLNGGEDVTAEGSGTYAFRTELQDGAPFEVTFTDPYGEDCTAETPSGTIDGADEIVTITCKQLVRPLYDLGQNWLDYVNADGTLACDASAVSRYTDCIHGGERRAVYVPDVADCNDLGNFRDFLEAFTWDCIDEDGPVELVSTGLAPGKKLSDLIDFATSSFKPNHVEIAMGADPITTDDAAWWNNDFDDALTAISLDQPGMIYLASSDPMEDLVLGGERVALVQEPKMPVETMTASLTVTGHDYVWVEGRFQGGADVDGARVGVLHFVSFGGSANIDDTHAMLLRDFEVRAGGSCINATGNFGIAVEDAKLHNCSVRLGAFDGNTGGYLLDSFGGGSAGPLIINNATGFAIDHLTISSIDGAGINVMGTSNGVHITRLTTAATELEGVRFDCTECSLRGATAVTSKVAGFRLEGTGSFFSELLAAGNPVGIVADSLFADGRNWVSIANVSATAPIHVNLINTVLELHGVLKVGGGTACVVDALSSGITNTTCAPSGMSSYALVSGAVLSSAFVAKVIANDPANGDDIGGIAQFADIDEWAIFRNQGRGWGPDGTAFPNVNDQGQCATGQCRIWDWSLTNSGSPPRDLNQAPTGAEIATVGTQTFLLSAFETLGDGFGDDDTLCESDEHCQVMPNAGAYQGHGSPPDTPAFTDGEIMNVVLTEAPNNGYMP
jgi:hypothetical protein